MRTKLKRALPIAGLLLVSALAIGGYRLWQNWARLGDTLGGVDFGHPAERVRAGRAPAERAGAAPDSPPSSDPATDEPPDVQREAAALRRALRTELAHDPELLESLNELFDEPDETILRDNLERLREAFLTEIPE